MQAWETIPVTIGFMPIIRNGFNRAQAQVLQVHAAWVESSYISAGSNPLPEHIRVVHRGVKRQDELLRNHGTRSACEVWVRKPKLASRLVGLGRP